MSRIAIYDPEPRVCGPSTWAHHLKAGFQELGHHCDVVVLTRSGKPSIRWGEDGMRHGIRWWSQVPDRVEKDVNGGIIFDSYDGVVLADVRTMLQDKEALKGRTRLNPEWPDYLAVLSRSQSPFTFALHGNLYPPSEVPFAARLIGLPNFTGHAITHSPDSPKASMEIWPNVVWHEAKLPYRIKKRDDPRAVSPGSAIGMTGRYVPNKGHHLLAMTTASKLLQFGRDIELWGACSIGNGPSQSYKTFEVLTQTLGLKGERHGEQPWTPSGGNLIRPYPWEVQVPDGPQIAYKGGYVHPVETAERLHVHVDLTAFNFSRQIEYAHLEAIDAGCRLVSVTSMWDPRFVGVNLNPIERMFGESKLINSAEGKDLMTRVAEAVEASVVLSETQAADHAAHNRGVAQRVHDPATSASVFLEALKLS